MEKQAYSPAVSFSTHDLFIFFRTAMRVWLILPRAVCERFGY